MDQQFQSIIEAAVRQAKARKSLLWVDEFARRIVSSTPLSVNEADLSERITQEAVRAGVAITVTQRLSASVESECCGVGA
jgi:hypothetical protein